MSKSQNLVLLFTDEGFSFYSKVIKFYLLFFLSNFPDIEFASFSVKYFTKFGLTFLLVLKLLIGLVFWHVF